MAAIQTSQTQFSANEQITSAKLNNILLQSSFAAGAVTTDGTLELISGQMQVGVLKTANIPANGVTTEKIADANITTAKITDLNVTTAKIADLNVTEGKIASNAVTQLKIGTNTVGRGPLARVYLNGTQTLSANTDSKVAFNAINYNTNSDYSLGTNRYTASVAGYYSFTAGIVCDAGQNFLHVSLRLNGGQFAKGNQSNDDTYSSTVSDMIYLAVGDFVEVYAYSNPGCILNQARFSAVMVRSGAN